MKDLTAIVLAGGKATRMGRGTSDKAFLKVDGVPIIERQLEVLEKNFKNIIIVTNSAQKFHHFKSVKLISDVTPGLGPLGGIYSGLLSSSDYYNFVFACDMPFINSAVITYMIDARDSYDIIIPSTNEGYHPLFGIYSKNCIPVIEKMLKDERLKISNIFPLVKTHFILEKEIENLDQNLLSLVNINTKEDLMATRKAGV